MVAPLLLGIETSCDETAAAVTRGPELLAHVTAAQAVHEAYGGVVPEFASRAHEQHLLPVTEQALKQAGVSLKDLTGIAVTQGPGLAGSLLVGVGFAKGLAAALNKPLLGINHIEGHIFANFIGQKQPPFPFLCLLVSGGHTMLVEVQAFRRYRLHGHTRDDAAGEAFDKTARILGLPYPGGPLLDKLAREGDPHFIDFPRTRFRDSYDFSFSGLKTAVLYYVQRHGTRLLESHRADLAAAFEAAAVDNLLQPTIQCARDTGLKRVVLAGGVAANSYLRDQFQAAAEQEGWELIYPELRFCTDNAAMIAYAGYLQLQDGLSSELDLQIYPRLKLDFSA